MFTFLKAQLSAFLGAVVDYLVMLALTELYHVPYRYSIMLGGIVGAIINFTINRYWTFDVHRSAALQLPRFALMVLGSILLKSNGTYIITELLGTNYKVSRLMMDALVAFGFNYPLQRYWVFAKKERMGMER